GGRAGAARDYRDRVVASLMRSAAGSWRLAERRTHLLREREQLLLKDRVRRPVHPSAAAYPPVQRRHVVAQPIELTPAVCRGASRQRVLDPRANLEDDFDEPIHVG